MKNPPEWEVRKKWFWYKGRRLSAAQCARVGGMSRQTFWERINRGYSVAKAIEDRVVKRETGCSYCGESGHYRPSCERLKKGISC